MDRIIKGIPKEHAEEFLKKQAAMLKSRLRLAALLLLVCVFSGDLISMLLMHSGINYQIKLTWAMSISFSAIALILSRKLITFHAVKRAVVSFTIAVLIVVAQDSINGRMPPFDAAVMYIFMFFGFSLIFPWSANEIIGVSLAHFTTYAVYLLNVPRYMYRDNVIATALPDYLDGIIFLFLASIVCYVVIKRDRRRDVESFILLKDIEDKGRQIKSNLELATRVHSRLMPHSVSTQLADIAVTYKPVLYMGGDYAKFHFIDKNKLVFIICDVTGHGVSAALLVNALNAEFERLAREGAGPGVLLKELNRFIVSDFAGVNMYMSAFCGVLDYSHFSRKFTYSNYGHPPQYIYRPADSSLTKLPAQASFLGLIAKDEKVYEDTVPFAKNDRVVLFTDGVIEAMDAKGEQYGYERLENFIRKNNNLQPEPFNKALLAELESFATSGLKDDVFILTIHTK